jgi:hypothetical protein
MGNWSSTCGARTLAKAISKSMLASVLCLDSPKGLTDLVRDKIL